MSYFETTAGCVGDVAASENLDQQYRFRLARDPREWLELFAALPQPQMVQSYAYGEAKRIAEGWGIVRCVFECGNTPLALCQVLEKRIAGVRVAARVNRGPLFLEPDPPTHIKANVLRLLRKQWSLRRACPLLIAPALAATEENHQLLREAGFRDRHRDDHHRSARVDLRQGEDALRKHLASTWRNRLRHAEKSGLELEVSDSPASIAWMLDRHAENMRTKNFHRPSPALVGAFCRSLAPGEARVLRAFADGEPLAGMLLIQYDRHSEYYVGWFGEQGRKFNCGNFLYWHCMLESMRSGCAWFDVGGYEDNEKYGHFKLGMRGVEYRFIGEWLSL